MDQIKNLKSFIDAVESIAFEIPAPNVYTPRLVQLCVEARFAFLIPKPDERSLLSTPR